MTETFHSELRGYSGASVQLHHSGRRSWVRKITNVHESTRIELEVQKLSILQTLGEESGLFKVPTVYEVAQTSDGLTYYDMEYIVGESVESHIEEIDPKQMQVIVERIGNIHAFFSSQTPQKRGSQTTEKEYLLFKLNETLEYLQLHYRHYKNHEIQIIEKYKELILRIKERKIDWQTRPSLAHGDLTLENILMDRQKTIVLIDPLMNEFDTVYWDIAKVLQSTLIQWGRIRNGRAAINAANLKVQIESSVKMREFHRYYWRNISENTQQAPLNLYLGVTLARIVKYAQNVDTKSILLSLTNDFLKLFVDGEVENGQYYFAMNAS